MLFWLGTTAWKWIIIIIIIIIIICQQTFSICPDPRLNTSTHFTFFHLLSEWISYSCFLAPFPLLLWGFNWNTIFDGCSPLFLRVWPIHLNFHFLISIFISVWPDNCHSSLFETVLGHQILNIYLRHLLINVWIFLLNSFVISQVSQPYKSTHLTQS
jgi:hypothetical protein